MLQIYNTLSRQKERFKPLKQDKVKIYYCGPTVYNYAHIWNLRAFVFEDYIIKSLNFLWYRTETTMNLTDIDDKTIRDSQVAGESLLDFTQKYTKYFLEDLEKLNITLADNITPISTLMPEMIEMINGLIKNWYGYLWDDGSIYYDIQKFKNYWDLAHLDFWGMKSSVRIDNDEYEKENAWDFVLWKAWTPKDGENFWEWEFVFGDKKVILKWRPGWHIECSACNMKHFGAQIDIHMWWEDLVFPHHQNEIAQSEGYFKKTFSKYWLHGWHLLVDGKKMSKSLNNFYTIKDLEDIYSDVDRSILYRSIRLGFMWCKYRDMVTFSREKLESNFKTIENIDRTVSRLHRALNITNYTWFSRDISDDMQWFISMYIEYLWDDFNMPQAMAVFFDFIKYINTSLDAKTLTRDELQWFIDLLKTFNQVLSIINFNIDLDIEIPNEVLDLLRDRDIAKFDGDYSKADDLRAKIWDMGYKVIDDKYGSRVEHL